MERVSIFPMLLLRMLRMAAALILLSTKFTSSFSVVSQWKATVGSPLERDRRLLFPQAATTTSTSSTTTRELGRLFSSFAADGSEYAAGDSDFDPEEDDEEATPTGYRDGLDDPEDETPTTELQPVPMSKNSGNRFVAIVWDRLFQTDDSTKDVLDLHHERISLTEEHVMFCRKQNLYNETFNAESMVDILWSLPILSSDLRRVIGHAMCLESTAIHHVQAVLAKDPILQMLSANDNGDDDDSPALSDKISLYRWRHIRDYSLRIDDGREGFPCLCLALDHNGDNAIDSSTLQLRQNVQSAFLETLIRSERVIAAGPLHLPTELKDDPSSYPVGDLLLFNARNRDDAIQFAQDLPSAQAGLYQTMRVHFYNTLDITGKFVSEDPLRDAPCEQMKEALEYWGYPVADEQTPWLNW